MAPLYEVAEGYKHSSKVDRLTTHEVSGVSDSFMRAPDAGSTPRQSLLRIGSDEKSSAGH